MKSKIEFFNKYFDNKGDSSILKTKILSIFYPRFDL